MKSSALLALFILGGVIAVSAAEPVRSTVAQAESRCGPRPMKPMSCLNGTWVCRCRASGQVCDWELIGCQVTPGTPRPLGESSGSVLNPQQPGMPGR